MKKPKTSTMVAAAAIALGLSAGGVGIIHAASQTGQNNPVSNLVSAISTKFNLNQSDVQQVFDQQHQQMEAQHQQKFTDHLAQDVKDGKLTQVQADAITSKMKELQTQRESDKTAMQSKTEAERQAYFKQQVDSLKQWATDNNIPAGYMPFGGPGMGRGHHGGPGMGMRMNDGDADDAQVVAPNTTHPATN